VKKLLLVMTLAVTTASLGLAPSDADARRLGGGRPAGMQRQAPPPRTTPNPAPTSPAQAPAAAPTTPAAAGTAAAPRRSWMGPLAGLAAGVGLAALFSHLGMGAGLSNVVMLALLALVGFVAVRWLLGRFAGGAAAAAGPQWAGAGAPASGGLPPPAEPLQRQSPADAPQAGAATAPVGATLPGGMAEADFVRLAKMVFIRMQAANDAGNVDDLRKFTTPELFASLRLDLQERGAARQQTDVVQIDAEVLETAQENGQDIVTVRFHGLIRENVDAGAEPFSELWHLVRPRDGQGDWAIAGITPMQ
jgi:predicted lipid-binding transport protein (Tim44 family)